MHGEEPNDNALFAIVGNELKTNAVFSYEVRQHYTILVEVQDQEGETFRREFTIDIINANEPPTNLNLDGTHVAENRPVGTLIVVLTTTDPDAAGRPHLPPCGWRDSPMTTHCLPSREIS